MHARAAHDIPTAVRASITAGQDAMSVGGPDEAAKHFETALELLGRAGRPRASTWSALVIKASDAVIATGHPARALALVTDQLRQLSADAPAEDRARLLIALAGHVAADRVARCLAEGIHRGAGPGRRGDRPPCEPGRSACMPVPTPTRAARRRPPGSPWRRSPSPSGSTCHALVAEATTTLAGIDNRAGQVDLALKSLQQVVDDRAARPATRPPRCAASSSSASSHFERTHLDQAQDAYGLAFEAAKAAGRPWAPYGFDARLMGAMVAYVRGDWDARADPRRRLRPEAARMTPRPLMLSVPADGRGRPR